MKHQNIPFSRPYFTGQEQAYLAKLQETGKLSGDGAFTRQCQQWFETHTGTEKALLTHSCTAALEMSALLLDIQPGDEFIVPSFTFVSTVNAFVLRGGVPVFIDIREDTLNMDEKLIEQAITPRTKAIVPVHYAGVACEMDTILAIAKKHNLKVVEDAAQGVLAFYKGQALGSIGDFGTYSFHDTKNIISGEGGALLINNPEYCARAEVIREKGTNRSSFLRGEVDKYTWQDIGSSFLPSELTAAFLLAQLESSEAITKERLRIWDFYHDALAELETQGVIRRPIIPKGCQHNAHIYYVLLSKDAVKEKLIADMKVQGVHPASHYVPLHGATAGQKFGRVSGNMVLTNTLTERLLRLPLWVGMTDADMARVVEVFINSALGKPNTCASLG